MWRKREPPPDVAEINRRLREISIFLMTMDANLDELIELIGGDDGEED